MPSQCDRILEILADGEWHEKSEFYGFCVLHSRISELRKRGFLIEYEGRAGKFDPRGGHWYRLAPLAEATAPLVVSESRAPVLAVLPEGSTPAKSRLGPDAPGLDPSPFLRVPVAVQLELA